MTPAVFAFAAAVASLINLVLSVLILIEVRRSR